MYADKLFSSPVGNDGNTPVQESNPNSIRGLSLTACRATMRATTGFSLTALRATLRAATGVSVTGLMKVLLGLFPQWARYFIQPFLILYYTPLMILRGLVGPTKDSRAEALQAHERILEEWKNAVKVAEAVNEKGYWPVRINDDGFIETFLPPDPDTILSEDIPGVIDVVAE